MEQGTTHHSLDKSIMNDISLHLATFLEIILPKVSSDTTWWNELVLGKLTTQQYDRARRESLDSLSSLDFAALLRILDQNWFELIPLTGFTSEERNYTKEMIAVRNRWAHVSANGISHDDLYRDLDTMQRFCRVIHADDQLIKKVSDLKYRTLYSRQAKEALHLPHKPFPADSSVSKVSANLVFNPGQMVVMKSNPESPGAVVSIIPGSPEHRVMVFLNGQIQSFYASQLEPYKEPSSQLQPKSLEEFFCHLTALQIRFPALSTLYSLNTARIDFIPYQLRPVLKFIHSDRPRLLIADGVGVGKTIEAGLILRELQARREIESVLIICPKPLVAEKKWQMEMRRFDERFTHLDGKTLRFCIEEMDIEGEWPVQHRKAILPYSLLDESLLFGTDKGRKVRKKGLLNLDPPPRFDLVIVDEAHHIRNTETYAHKAIRFLSDNAEAVLFLTATPIQLGNNDLFVLLNVLRPDLVIDIQSFSHMSEPNPFINQAVNAIRGQLPEWQETAKEQLLQAAQTPWGRSILSNNPYYVDAVKKLSYDQIDPEQRIKLLNQVESLHTFASIINRTRRRDIGDFTIRTPDTVSVPFTAFQQKIHDGLLDIQAEIMARLHGNRSVKFLLSTIRRQVSSCVFGLAPYLHDILNRHMDELIMLDGEDDEFEENPDWLAVLDSQIRILLEEVKQLPPEDPKLFKLCEIVSQRQSLPNNKVMLFSSFRHTLKYLYDKLSKMDVRIGLIHGDIDDDQRLLLRDRFAKPKESSDAIDLMLFSEVGSEGLDYQFCDCMVNYDLPWNPMRIEQRIGRIDRNGQKSERVNIYNFITPGTIDAEIYDRCLVRIGVFSNSLGASEEIMGEITKEIKDIAENYTLTEGMRSEKLQQLADNKIRLVQEQEMLEQKQLELFGIKLPENQMQQDIKDASSYWLSSDSIHRLIKQYLKDRLGDEQEYILGDKPIKTLRLGQESREILLQDYKKFPRQANEISREWESWLKGANPHFPITFDAESSRNTKEAALIIPIHPLVKQAANNLAVENQIVTTIRAKVPTHKAGTYEFALYQWRFTGIKEDLKFQPIMEDPSLNDKLMDIFEEADDMPEAKNEESELDRQRLDTQHYQLWSQAREQHLQDSKRLIEFRKESLVTSHHARIALLKGQLENATDEKIMRMRQSQLASAEMDFLRRVEELKSALQRADITAEPVAYGFLIIEE